MHKSLWIAGLLLASLVGPAALAAENTTKIDVDVNNPPQQSTNTVFLGMDGTTLVIILVVGVILIALVAALAGRDRYW